MRRIARLERSIDLLRTRTPTHTPSAYLCLTCKQHRAAPFSTSAIRAANEKVASLEKLRRKIWGTESPPGQADPYGDASVFDQTKKRRQEKEAQEREERRVATTPIPDDSSYEPATTWDGLEHVGGFGHWWKENWDPEHKFDGFLPKEVMSDSGEITAALHRAMVEVLALQQAGMPLEAVSLAAPGEDRTWEVQIVAGAAGPFLQFTGSASLESVVQALAPVLNESQEEGAPTESEEDVDADKSVDDPLNLPKTFEGNSLTEEDKNPTESQEDLDAERSPIDYLRSESAYKDILASWDPSWLQVPLENPQVKFAIIKRTMQITGLRIPDSAIKPSRTAQNLLAHLIKPPKPRKVLDSLEKNEALLSLPNVHVHPRRITPIDKEKSVGRWKVIEQELEERGLPVTGRQTVEQRRSPVY